LFNEVSRFLQKSIFDNVAQKLYFYRCIPDAAKKIRA